MEDLEKLVQAFANGLCIKYTATSEDKSGENTPQEVPKTLYKFVPFETKEAFKKAMQEHLEKSLGLCHIGCSVTYDYSIGRIRNARPEHKDALTVSICQNLLDIFEELPELAEGEEYVFTTNMKASVKVTGFNEDKIITQVEKCSNHIASALQEM